MYSRCSSVTIVSGRPVFDSWQGQKFFLSQQRPDNLRGSSNNLIQRIPRALRRSKIRRSSNLNTYCHCEIKSVELLLCCPIHLHVIVLNDTEGIFTFSLVNTPVARPAPSSDRSTNLPVNGRHAASHGHKYSCWQNSSAPGTFTLHRTSMYLVKRRLL